MSWTDKEIDELFQNAAKEKQSFVYKGEYWGEMESLLPEKKTGRDLLWIVSSMIFGTVLIGAMLRSPANDSSENILVSENNANETELSREVFEQAPLNEEDNAPITKYEDTKLTGTINEKDVPSTNDIENSIPVIENTKYKLDDESSDVNAMTSMHETVGSPINSLKALPYSTLDYNVNELLSLQQAIASTSHAFYLQSVVGASQSLLQPSTAMSGSFGIGAGYALRKGDLVFNGGVNLIISSQSDLYLTRTAKVYGFGSSFYTYNFNYRQLFELEGNFELGYQLNRSEFKVGIRPSYLLSAKVNISSDSDNAQDIMSEEKQVYSFTDGLRRFGIRPTIGYAFHLKPDLELGLNMGVQLMTKVDPNYIQGDPRKFALDGQLYLRKNLSWKKR